MQNILTIVQAIIAIILIISILLQQRGTALGSSLGGGDSGSFYSTRRGIQKKLLWLTIISGFLFIALSLLNLLI
jgi:protein translocase SecG subunit